MNNNYTRLKKILIILLVTTIILTFTSCNFNTQTYNVTFVYNNGKSNKNCIVKNGNSVSTPKDPSKNNYIFTGWYTGENLITKYDFSESIYKDLTLYAGYELDAKLITNKISTNNIKGILKIFNKNYDTFLGMETSSLISQGSGFCFHIQDGYYYILTNCHVAKRDTSYSKQKFTIEDYQGKYYEAFLYKSPNKSKSAIDPAYDLACLYFKPNSTNVKSFKISYKPEVFDDVIALGAPKGQNNAITYGKVTDYRKIKLSNCSPSKSDVKFDVIQHVAYINSGSSGGPLLNSNLDIVGVNYASTRTSNINYKYSYAIPADKVNEFLYKYVYN